MKLFILLILSVYLAGCNPLTGPSSSDGDFDFSYNSDTDTSSNNTVLKIDQISPSNNNMSILDGKIDIVIKTNMLASCHLDSLANQANTDAVLLMQSDNNMNHQLKLLVGPETQYNYLITCETLNQGGLRQTHHLGFKTPQLEDFTPPVISVISPIGELPASTINAEIRVGTNETSSCRYSTSSIPYSAMNLSLQASSNGSFHSVVVPTKAGMKYQYFVECIDLKGNSSLSPSIVGFQIAPEGAQDKIAPILSNLFPSQNLQSGTTSTNIMVTTNENANCRWSTNNALIFTQMSPMQVTGSFNHSQIANNLIGDQGYSYYIQCQDSAQNTSAKSIISFKVNSIELDGSKLYATHCMSCHAALPNSTKLNRNAQQISNAIQSVSVMNNLSFLQAQQIAEIAKVLYVQDTQAPVISDAAPSGIQPKALTNVVLSVKTNEPSLCKYHNSNIAYDVMSSTMTASSNGYIHSGVQAVAAGVSYQFYVRCKDEADNKNLSSTLISFSIEAANAPDTTAPLISNALPSGKLTSGTSQVTLSLATNESAACRYSNSSSADYLQMSAMNITGTVAHSQVISGLSDGNNYNFYVICSDAANNKSLKQTITFEVPILNLDGASLYTENCMGCHGPLNSSNKKNRSVTQITDAIAQNTAMKNQAYLKALSNIQITAIAKILAGAQPPTGTPAGDADQKYVIGTRRYIVSKLSIIFVNDNKNTEDTKIENHITNLVKNNDASNFGGACIGYDNDCPGASEEIQVSGLMTPSATSVRRSYMIRACHNILSIDRSVENALLRAGLNINSAGDSDQNINTLYNLFYPGVDITTEVRNDLKAVFTGAKQNGMSNTGSWRMILSPLCKSALFEIY